MLSTWGHTLFRHAASPRSTRRSRRRVCRLHLEVLEDRAVPTAYNSAFNGELSEASWMQDLPDSMTLNQMSIPLAHDTMTDVGNYFDYDVTGKILPSFGFVAYGYNGNRAIPLSGASADTLGVVGQTVTQARSLTQLLNDGIRMIDLRAGYYLSSTGIVDATDPNVQKEINLFGLEGPPSGTPDFGLVHGNAILSFTPVIPGLVNDDITPVRYSDVVNTVEQWLSQHQKETVILHVQTDGAIAPSQDYVHTVEQYYATVDPSQWYTSNVVPALGQVRGKIVLYDDSATKWTTSSGASLTVIPHGIYNVSDTDSNFAQAIGEIWGDNFNNINTALNTPSRSNWVFSNNGGSILDSTQALNGWSPEAYAILGASTDVFGTHAPDTSGNPPSSQVPLNELLYHALSTIQAGRVGTIWMDYPEFIDANTSALQGPTEALIDEIIGLNWPYLSVDSSAVTNGANVTIAIHSMQTGQNYDIFTTRPDPTDSSKTIQYFLGTAADQGNGTYTLTYREEEDSTDVQVTASAVLVGYPSSSSTLLPATATIHVTGPVPARTTTTAVAGSQTTAVAGTSITFTATVTAPMTTVAPQGTVEFFSGGTDLGAGVFQDSSAATGTETSTWTFTTSRLPVGNSQDIHAVFTGATGFQNSTGTLAGGQTILAARWAIAEVPTGASANGQAATVGTVYAIPIRVQVTDLAGNPVSRALVDFTAPTSGASGLWAILVQGSLEAQASNPVESFADSSGIATVYFIANQTPGTFDVTAESPLNTRALTFQVTNTAVTSTTSTAVTSSQATAAYGTSVTYTATVANTGGSTTPSGSVEFFDGSTALGAGSALNGSGVTATSTFTTSTLSAAGSPHTIKAVYTPNGAFSGSSGNTPETINPAPLTGTIINDPTKPYDGTTTATLTSANYQLSGLVNGDLLTITQTTGTYNSKDVASASTVTVNLAPTDFAVAAGTLASNYVLPNSASGPGQITTAPLIITANDQSKVYGQALTFTGTEFTATGLAHGETVGTVALLSRGAAASAPVSGSPYPIQVSGASGGTADPDNYKLSYGNGSLTVLPASTMSVVRSSFNPSVAGQSLTFTATVTALVPSTAVPTGTVQFLVNNNPLGSPQPLGSTGSASLSATLAIGSDTVSAAYANSDGNFSTSPSNQLMQTVQAITASTLQAAVDQAAATGQPLTLQTDPASLANPINAVDHLHAPSKPVTLTINLASGTCSGIVVGSPANLTLNLVGSSAAVMFVGHSPALTVTTGQVSITGVSFTTTTNTPTILVQGGALTLRQDTVQAAPLQAAVFIIGGSVDLGTSATAGGNTFIATPISAFLVNQAANPVSALGDTFQIKTGSTTTPLDTSKLADDFTIADHLVDGRELSSGLVTIVANQAYVTPLTGGLQRTVNAVPAGSTINVEVPSDRHGRPLAVDDLYHEYTVSQPLTLAFQNGPTLQLAADNLFGPNTTTLRVTGGPQDNAHLSFRPGDRGSTVEVGIAGDPEANFSPTGGLVVHGGGGKNAHIEVAAKVTMPALLFADGADANLQAGGGPTVEVGSGGNNTHLEGGAGRNILIAGPGSAHLEGKGGDDVLIGGSTAYEHNELALAALLQEWNHPCDGKNRLDDYLIRAAHLTGGPLPSSAPAGTPSTGLNGDVLLTSATVQSNGGHNHLDGGSGLDLFFAAATDKVDGVRNGEQILRPSTVRV